MSDTDYDDDEQVEFEDNRTRTVPRDVWKRMEKQAKEAQALAEQNAALNRRLAFSDAGISTTDPKLSYFVKGYDGPLTTDAIRQAAVEAGFLNAPEPAVPEADLAAHDRLSQAAAGASGSSDVDIEAGMRLAAQNAPRGQEGAAIAEFMRRQGLHRFQMPSS